MPASWSSPSLLSVAQRAELPSGQLSAVESSTLIQALGAVMAGAHAYAAIAEWAAAAQTLIRPCGWPPSEPTFHRVLSAVDVVAVEAALAGWVLGRRAVVLAAQAGGGPVAEHRCVLAVDGKTLRGGRRPDSAQAKLISVYEHGHRLLLAPVGVVDGEEIAAFTLATLPDLRGVVVTADGCTASASTPTGCTTAAGTTCLPSRPTSRSCAGPWPRAPGGGIAGTGGPSPARSRSSTGTPIRLGRCLRHPAIKAVRFRRCTATGHRSREIVYAVTALDYRAADPGLLAAWIHRHWAIENAVHHLRDVTQGEDASRIPTGSGPQVMAALRNTALNLARLDGHANTAQAQRRASWTPDLARQTLAAA